MAWGALFLAAAATVAWGAPINIGSLTLHEKLSATAVTPENLVVAGMDAAVNEVNSQGGVQQRPVQLVFPDAAEANQTRRLEQYIARVVGGGDISAVTGADFGLENVLAAIATGSDVPILSSRTVDPRFFARGGGALARSSLHIYQELATEVRQLLNFAIRGRHRCYSVGVTGDTAFPGFSEVFAAITADLVGIQYPRPVFISAPMEGTGAQLYANMRQAMDASATNLTCFIMLSDSPAIKQVIDLFQQDPAFRSYSDAGAAVRPQREAYFFATSFSNSQSYRTAPSATPPSSTIPYRHLYLSQSLPAPTGDYIVAQKFRAAFAHVVANASLRSARVGGLPYALPTDAAAGHDHSAMLGYLSVRLALELLRRTDNVTDHAALLRTAYSTRMFPLDDYVLGPFTDGCLGRQTNATGTCRCNSGTRRVFATSIGPRGYPVALVEDPESFEKDVAEMDVPLTTCGLTATFSKPVGQALVVFDLARPAAELDAASRVLKPWGDWIVANRARLTIDILPVVYIGVNITVADQEALAKRYLINAIVASTAPNPSRLPSFKLGSFSYELPERDLPYGPLATYDYRLVRVNPVLADTIHVAMAHAAGLGLIKSVHAIVDTASALDLAQRSLETFGGRDLAGGTVLSAAQATLAALPASGFVLVASQRPGVMRTAQELAGGTGATVVLCGSEYVLEDHRVAGANRALFVSGLERFTTGPNATASYGVLYGEALLGFTNLGTTEAAITNAIFAAGAIATISGNLAPLSRTSCGLSSEVWPHPGGTCQCRKGLNRFFVRRVADWDNASAATVFSYAHAECGVRYTPYDGSLTTAELSAIVAGSALFVGSVVFTAVMVYVCCCRSTGRDNKNAPKDERQAFAMVFTDIQASTTLWARAPQHMGLGLDTHHRVLRDLVAQHKGYEVKTIGDSFMVAFQEVEPAMRFALAIQSRLFDHDWGTRLFDETYQEMLAITEEGGDGGRGSTAEAYDSDVWNGIRVRVGVHYGTGSIRQDETSLGFDYYGTVVNTAARVEGVAHGGQVLLTKAAFDSLTHDGVRPLPPTTAIVMDLGLQPLRGLDEPVGLLQLLPPRFARREFPPLRLDKEIVVETSDSSTEPTHKGASTATPHGSTDQGTDNPNSRTSNRSANREITVEGLAKEVTRRARSQVPPGVLLLLHVFTHHFYSTSTPAYRRGAIRHLAEKWRVPAHPSRWMRAYERHEGIGKDQVTLMQAVMRAARTMDCSSGGCEGNVSRLRELLGGRESFALMSLDNYSMPNSPGLVINSALTSDGRRTFATPSKQAPDGTSFEARAPDDARPSSAAGHRLGNSTTVALPGAAEEGPSPGASATDTVIPDTLPTLPPVTAAATAPPQADE